MHVDLSATQTAFPDMRSKDPECHPASHLSSLQTFYPDIRDSFMSVKPYRSESPRKCMWMHSLGCVAVRHATHHPCIIPRGDVTSSDK